MPHQCMQHAYLVQAWDVGNSCKHNGVVLPFSSAPVGRRAGGVDAMSWLGAFMMMMIGACSDCLCWPPATVARD
jgi:hypothetical protein